MQEKKDKQRSRTLLGDRVFSNYVLTTSIVAGIAMISFSISGFTMIGGFDAMLKEQQTAVVQAQPEDGQTPISQKCEIGVPSAELKDPADAVMPVPESTPQETPAGKLPEHHTEKANPAASDKAEVNIVPMETEVIPTADIDVYPVGYGSFRIVIVSESEGLYAATLADASNTEIVRESYEVQYGRNEFVLKSGSIPRGNYLLTVTDGTVVKEKRVALK